MEVAYEKLRSFRNKLIVATVVLAVFLIAIGVDHATSH
jgi:hypothetical protein